MGFVCMMFGVLYLHVAANVLLVDQDRFLKQIAISPSACDFIVMLSFLLSVLAPILLVVCSVIPVVVSSRLVSSFLPCCFPDPSISTFTSAHRSTCRLINLTTVIVPQQTSHSAQHSR